VQECLGQKQMLWKEKFVSHEKLSKSTATKNIEDFPLESNESSELTALTEKGTKHELHLLLRAALNRGHQLTQAEHLLLRAQRLLNQIILFAMQKAEHDNII
jgi:hypothetical protein